MLLTHERINLLKDKEYILERHCRINYECDCPWQRKLSYEKYRNNWFELRGQVNDFLFSVSESLNDTRTIGEIIKDEHGRIVAYLWVPFFSDNESGFSYADIQDLYVESEFRNLGIASKLIEYAERRAKESGAKTIRSGTGCENQMAINLHNKHGYYQYRIEFEKLL